MNVLSELLNMSKQRKTIVILGNGFDLDIGLPTSYNAFVESEVFKKFLSFEPSKHQGKFKNQITRDIGLMHCVLNEKVRNKWVDLEIFLTDYAKEGRINIVKNDMLVSCNI